MGHKSTRHLLKDLTALAGSGLVSLLGFVLITSGRWPNITSEQITFIVLFSQWEILTVTIGSLGVKDAVYAAVTKDHTATFDFEEFLLKRSLPAVILCTVFVGMCFSWVCAPWILLSALLDVYAVDVSAELNGRAHHSVVAAGNLTNYPLFFVALLVLSPLVPLGKFEIMALFTATSVFRAAYLHRINIKARVDCHVMHLTAMWNIGSQQGLNYLLFRLDQLLLGAPFLAALFGSVPVRQYLFLVKFPELIAGMVSIGGVVLLPRIFVKYPLKWREVAGNRITVVVASSYLSILVVGTFLYRITWKGSPIEMVAMLPFLAHAILVLPVNVITYSMLRQGYLRSLVVFLGYSVGNCAAAVVVAGAFGYAIRLQWLIPLQLAVFLLLACTASWGEPMSFYKRRETAPDTLDESEALPSEE